MKNNANVNVYSTNIETNKQKRGRNAVDLIATVLVVLTTILLCFSIIIFCSSYVMNSKMDAAPTGEEMLNGILLYGMENVSPFDIVIEKASYKGHDKKNDDEYTALAVALGEYSEAALYRYAYEYVGDSTTSDKYQKIMNEAKEKMEVHSYADYIDKSYEKFSK